MKLFSSKTQKKGEYAENICVKWLDQNGFSIIERNYNSKYGEIDIIAKKDQKLHFIEVKSVSCENTEYISRETYYNPADNVSREKINKCIITMNIYIQRYDVSYETQFDVYLIYVDKRNIKHLIERIENVV